MTETYPIFSQLSMENRSVILMYRYLGTNLSPNIVLPIKPQVM